MSLTCPECGQRVWVRADKETDDWSRLNTATICPDCSPGLYLKCSKFLALSLLWSSQPADDLPFLEEARPTAPEKVRIAKEDFGKAAIDLLERCARQGNQLAAEALLEVVVYAVQRLQLMSTYYSRLYQPMARQMLVWPAMYSCRKSFNALIAEPMIKRLELGKDAPGRSKSSPTSRSSRVVQCLLFWLCLNQTPLGLPALATTTSRLWFEVGWRKLVYEAGDNPHKNPISKRLGRSAANKGGTRRGMDRLTRRMRRDDILGKAKEVVWKAFRTQVSRLKK